MLREPSFFATLLRLYPDLISCILGHCALFSSLFQALGQWKRSNKRVGDERGLVENEERSPALSFFLPYPARRPPAFSGNRPH